MKSIISSQREVVVHIGVPPLSTPLERAQGSAQAIESARRPRARACSITSGGKATAFRSVVSRFTATTAISAAMSSTGPTVHAVV